MISPKTRAELKKQAQSEDVVAHIGKLGITDSVIESVKAVSSHFS